MNRPKTVSIERKWRVFSTALKQGWLMLYDANTGDTGSVRDPLLEEWEKAFYAPSNPYQWLDNSRVVIDFNTN